MITLFGLNLVNLILIERLKGSHLMMNIMILHLEGQDDKQIENWSNQRELITDTLMAVATCLRLSRSVSEWLRNKKNYLNEVMRIIKHNLRDKDIVRATLVLFKTLLASPETVTLVSQQYNQIQIIFLQTINQHQTDNDIVKSAIFCMKRILAKGSRDPKVNRACLNELF